MKKETKLTRRQLLRASALAGTGAVLAACAPAAPAAPAAAPAAPAATEAPAAEAPAATEAPAEEPAPTEAPAAAGAGGTVQVLHRQEYFKELEDVYKQQTEEFITSLGYTPDVSTVNPELFGDFMAKMQAAVAAGNPPDLTYHGQSISQMYDQELTEDHTALVDELVSKFGAIVPSTAERNAKIDGKWWAAPQSSNIGGWYTRKDWADEAGVDLSKFSTMQDRLDVAVKISDPSKERFGWGMTVNKSGDGHGLITVAFQAFGGRAVDESGQKIAFNSPETIEGIKWLAAIYSDPQYKDILPPGVESWTDPSNNEAFLAGKTGITLNAPSVYAAAKKDQPDLFPNISWQNYPTTNDGSVVLGAGGNQWYTIMKGAKQPDAAKQIVLHFMDPVVFTPLSILGGGLVMPAYLNGWTPELLAADPNFPNLQTIMTNPSDFTGFPYPAQANAAIDAWFATGFLSEMMTNIITGKMTVEEAVKDGTDKGVVIFEEKGLPQS